MMYRLSLWRELAGGDGLSLPTMASNENPRRLCFLFRHCVEPVVHEIVSILLGGCTSYVVFVARRNLSREAADSLS